MKKVHKITPDVRKQIEQLTETLPNVPFLTKDSKGKVVVQKIKKTELVSGQSLIERGVDKVEGSSINNKKNYISSGFRPRLMNHKVELNNAYTKDGQFGIDSYVAYVNQLYQTINAVNTPTIPDKKVMPVPEDYGFVSANGPEEESHWSIEGGENAYDAALAEYYDSEAKEKYPANVEGSKEFNEVNELENKEKEKELDEL